MKKNEELVDWIDDLDDVVESLPRSEIRARNLLHRVSATLVFDSNGRLFIHQRTTTKDVYPGLFDLMVGGTVTSGESYAQNACREIAEELGVRGVPLYHLLHHRYQDQYTNNQIYLFACRYEGEITLQPEEVADGFWADEVKTAQVLAKGGICPDSLQGFRMFKRQYGSAAELLERMDRDLPPIHCHQWVQ